MGTPEFSVPCLEALIARKGCEVAGVFTQPDRPKGRGNKMTASPVKETALKAGFRYSSRKESEKRVLRTCAH